MARPPHLYNKVIGTRNGNIRDNEPSLEIIGDVVLARTGAGRVRGFNATRRRFELYWLAGAGGLPQLNAVTDPSGGDAYSTVPMTALLNADRDFEILGTNAASSCATINVEGGVKLTTTTGASDSVILLPHLNSGQSRWTDITWGTDQETTVEYEYLAGTSVANSVVHFAGMKITNTPVIATDDDQAFFRVVGGANFQCVTSIGGTDVSTDSGIALAASTSYHLKIVIDAARKANYYINGAYITQSAAMTDATDLVPYIGILNGSGAAKHLTVRQIAISRNFA